MTPQEWLERVKAARQALVEALGDGADMDTVQRLQQELDELADTGLPLNELDSISRNQ